jgi:thioredoxin-related protein
MKKIVLLLSLPAILLTAGGLKDSLLQAKKEQKPLMVLVTSESCRYCAKMKKDTLSNQQVKDNLDGFLFATVLKTSVDAKRYLPKTRYTPTVFFVSSEYKIINSVKGYLGAKDFNMWVKDTRRKLGMSVQAETTQKSATVSYVKPQEDDVWMYDIASAMDFASQTGKQIMVYVGSTKSQYSKKMEDETLKSKKVHTKLDDFVWVKLNHGDKEAKAYGINPSHVPTVYFMKADMSELAVAKGYFGVKDFLTWVKYAKSKI